VSVEAHAELAARVEASFAAEDWDVDSASVEDAIGLLDRGEVRVAEPTDGGWVVNEWPEAVLLLRVRGMETIESGLPEYHDKPLKHGSSTPASGWCSPPSVRGVPVAGVILAGYVNIGAWVGPAPWWPGDAGPAQIGANVHLSGGAGWRGAGFAAAP
jgi:2,3,4,5-tetrahydropyridine-2-carboxylate N-succinyltransferase